jgi:hypothetical protein
MNTHPTRRAAGTAALLAVALTAVATLLTACDVTTADAICEGGPYPVQSIGSTGGYCVKDGRPVPKGEFRYPAAKTPKHVDDTWDRYWRTHTMDKRGRIIKAPPVE